MANTNIEPVPAPVPKLLIKFYMYRSRKCDMCGAIKACMVCVSTKNKREHNYCAECSAEMYFFMHGEFSQRQRQQQP